MPQHPTHHHTNYPHPRPPLDAVVVVPSQARSILRWRCSLDSRKWSILLLRMPIHLWGFRFRYLDGVVLLPCCPAEVSEMLLPPVLLRLLLRWGRLPVGSKPLVSQASSAMFPRHPSPGRCVADQEPNESVTDSKQRWLL